MIYPKFKKGKKSYWGNLYQGSEYLPLLDWVGTQNKTILLIANDTAHAKHIEQGLDFYGANSGVAVLLFPDYETLAYDVFSPHEDTIATRLQTLAALSDLQRGIIIATVESLVMQLCPQSYIKKHHFKLKVGDTLNLTNFRQQLINLGYYSVHTVREYGEFSVKGSLLDFYPIGAKHPTRIDLFDEQIESIRLFDQNSQRTIKQVTIIDLLPAKEFSLSPAGIRTFLCNYQARFGQQDDPICHEITQGRTMGGIESYLPLFFAETQSLFAYLPPQTILVFWQHLSQQVEKNTQHINARYEKAKLDKNVLKPNELYLSEVQLFSYFAKYQQLVLSVQKKSGNVECYNHPYQALPAVRIEHSHPQAARKLLHFLGKYTGRVLLISETPSRQVMLLDLLKNHDQRLKIGKNWQEFMGDTTRLTLIISQLDDSLLLPEFAVITEKSLFGQSSVQQSRRRAKHKDFSQPIKNLVELNVGDAVVHERYGVGRYWGLKTLSYDEQAQEFVVLLYANDDKLMVPIDELTLISQYSGVGHDNIPLHRLGTQQWAKIRKKAEAEIFDMAAELLEIYAHRASQTGFACYVPDDGYQSFTNEFTFEETPDQQSTITAVINDMQSSQPMDRLVCGDVGFGKTEIAMRAAYLAVASGRQVVVLVPTTLLADQHYRSFVERFINYPVSIAMLSRFQSHKVQHQTLEKLAQGFTDIVIGTHKLLQKRVHYKNLGLVIIDEEHRFGVRQKEVLKKIRAQCDILTMSATPIPRTLNMALGEVRDLSIISTPPLGRSAIKTFVSEWSDTLVIEACAREVHRAGQVFILHNDIDSIDKFTQDLSDLVPNVKLRIAHGQMPTKALENIMSDFYHHRFHILVCTTIIETGIDIPNANTIIINNAQNFGLAQLHQLRGRVGRSHHQAYAYLIVKSQKSLSEDAKKRLNAITSLEALGSGFMLANHDLEIRGAGDLLGKSQSGNIQAVGFSFYQDLLRRAVTSLRSGQMVQTSVNTLDIDTGISCIIPQDYLGDAHDRLIFYKRIAAAKTPDELSEIKAEMIDRFYRLSPPIESLFAKTELSLFAKPLGLKKITINDDSIRFVFSQNTCVKVATILTLINENSHQFALKKQDTLLFLEAMPRDIRRIKKVQEILQLLVA